MEIQLFDIHKDVSVTCDIGVIPIEGTYREIGYFKVSGQYKPGSAGSRDAKHICGMMAYAQERFYKTHWILDLSELSYEWGDEMDMVLEFDTYEGIETVACVYGPDCIEAVATLGGIDRKPEDLLREEGNFQSLDDAFDYIKSKIL